MSEYGRYFKKLCKTFLLNKIYFRILATVLTVFNSLEPLFKQSARLGVLNCSLRYLTLSIRGKKSAQIGLKILPLAVHNL